MHVKNECRCSIGKRDEMVERMIKEREQYKERRRKESLPKSKGGVREYVSK
jgi:hypothetical protein